MSKLGIDREQPIPLLLSSGGSRDYPNAEGSRLTSSVVAFTKDGERIVGFSRAAAINNPERPIASIKKWVQTTRW